MIFSQKESFLSRTQQFGLWLAFELSKIHANAPKLWKQDIGAHASQLRDKFCPAASVSVNMRVTQPAWKHKEHRSDNHGFQFDSCTRGNTLRVQVPNSHLLTKNLYHNYYYPNPKYLIIGYMDPLGQANMELQESRFSRTRVFVACGAPFKSGELAFG